MNRGFGLLLVLLSMFKLPSLLGATQMGWPRMAVSPHRPAEVSGALPASSLRNQNTLKSFILLPDRRNNAGRLAVAGFWRQCFHITRWLFISQSSQPGMWAWIWLALWCCLTLWERSSQLRLRPRIWRPHCSPFLQLKRLPFFYVSCSAGRPQLYPNPGPGPGPHRGLAVPSADHMNAFQALKPEHLTPPLLLVSPQRQTKRIRFR